MIARFPSQETTEFNSSSTSSTSSIATAVAPVTVPAAAATAAAPDKPAPKADLFSALNKGGAITSGNIQTLYSLLTAYFASRRPASGLKTVTKDMQTWRAEYKGGDAPVPAPVATKKAVAPRVQETVKGPPKLEFQQDSYKWLVEFQSGPAEVNIGDKRETVSTTTTQMMKYNIISYCVGLHLRLCGCHCDGERKVQEHQRGLLQEDHGHLRYGDGLVRNRQLSAN